MYVLHVASQIIHSGCYKLTLWAWEIPFLVLVFAFNMAHKTVLYGEGAVTLITFVSDPVMFRILMSFQMTCLFGFVGALVTREFGQIIFDRIVHVHEDICWFYAPFARNRIIYLLGLTLDIRGSCDDLLIFAQIWHFLGRHPLLRVLVHMMLHLHMFLY